MSTSNSGFVPVCNECNMPLDYTEWGTLFKVSTCPCLLRDKERSGAAEDGETIESSLEWLANVVLVVVGVNVVLAIMFILSVLMLGTE